MRLERQAKNFIGNGVSVLAITFAIVSGLFPAIAVNATPADASRIAAVFPPWWSPAETVMAAGAAGDIAAAGAAPFIVILRGDPIDLAQRARLAGALFILDPNMAGVCAPKDPSQ